MKDNKLIECHDHNYAPWSIVCRHLLEGTRTDWQRIPMGPGEQDDWLCTSCADKGPDGIRLEDICCVCIHCVRELRRAALRQKEEFDD